MLSTRAAFMRSTPFIVPSEDGMNDLQSVFLAFEFVLIRDGAGRLVQIHFSQLGVCGPLLHSRRVSLTHGVLAASLVIVLSRNGAI